MDSLNERFLNVIDSIGISGYQLAKEANISEGTVSNIRQGKTKPGTQLIEWLLQKYPTINADYLFRGVGDPNTLGVNTRQTAKGINHKQQVSVGSGQNNLVMGEDCEKLLKAKDDVIDALRKTIELYEKILKDK